MNELKDRANRIAREFRGGSAAKQLSEKIEEALKIIQSQTAARCAEIARSAAMLEHKPKGDAEKSFEIGALCAELDIKKEFGL